MKNFLTAAQLAGFLAAALFFFLQNAGAKTNFRIEIDSLLPCLALPNVPADSCQAACALCNSLNGFVGTTVGVTPSFVPSFCGSVETDIWFGFTAAATTVTLEVTPVSGSCQNGNGLQIALYKECDGPFIQCNVGCSGCGEVPQSITVTTMIPGHDYLLLIDGWAGDQCDFSISVNPPGAVANLPVGPNGPFVGPSASCPGGLETFCIDDVAGAGTYIWSIPADAEINGQPGPGPIWLDAPDGRCAEITFGSTGQATVCVTARNACEIGQQSCQLIDIHAVTPTILPPVDLCPTDALTWLLPWGEPVLPTPGSVFYEENFAAGSGCDSTVVQEVRIDGQFVQQLLPQAICQGDTFFQNGLPFFESGFYQIPTTNGGQPCDSVVQFKLTVLQPFAQILGETGFCLGSSTTLQAAPNSLGAPPVFSWKNAAGQLLGTAKTLTVNELDTIILTVSKSLAGVVCSKSDTVILTFIGLAPDLTATGGTIDCLVPFTVLTANSSTAGVNFEWSNAAGNLFFGQMPTVFSTGIYTVVATAAAGGCSSSTTVEVTFGDLQNTFFLFENPSEIPPPNAVFQSVLIPGNLLNQLSEAAEFRWTRTFIDLTGGCLSQVIDQNGGWGTATNSGQISVNAGEIAPLSVLLEDDSNTACCGIVHLLVRNLCTLRDTATFVYKANCTVPTGEPGRAAVRIFPNPSDGLFFIENSPETAVFLEIIDLNGRRVSEKRLADGLHFSLKNELAGTFFAVFKNEKRELVGVEMVVLQR